MRTPLCNSVPVHAPMPYRPEIDGLRAIAVLAVIIFHAKLGWLSGGFVGVDVFFVISGFLITSIIARENETIGFDIFRFYERRVRRIFPVLSVVVATTAVLSALVLVPRDYVGFAKSAIAAMAFYSNFFFSDQAGYFMPAAETQPLLHTWSLGVEEQFYLLAPMLILVLDNRFRRFRTWIYVALLVISLAISARGVAIGSRWAFYHPHSRAFELLIGSIIALRLVPPVTANMTANAMGLIGLALIGGAAAGYNSNTPFPGFAALLPTIGAALIIHSSTHVKTIAARCLSIAPMLAVGRISYSLYLWHWPLLALAEYEYGHILQPHHRLALLGLAVVLSVLTYFVVEQPARKARISQASVLTGGVASIAMCAVVSVLIVKSQGWPGRLSVPAAKLALELDAQAAEDRKAAPACIRQSSTGCPVGRLDTNQKAFILWGDSFSATFAPEFDRTSTAGNLAGLVLGRGGCPPLLDWQSQQFSNCPEVARLLETALQNPLIKQVIIVARWSYYAPGAPHPMAPAIQDHLLVTGDPVKSVNLFGGLLQSTVEKIRRAGKRVTLIGPVPELAVNLPLFLMKAAMRGQNYDIPVSRAQFEARQAPVLATLRKLALLDGVEVVYPHEYLCSETFCHTVADGKALYVDDNHLSITGVRQLRPMIEKILLPEQVPAGLASVRTQGIARP